MWKSTWIVSIVGCALVAATFATSRTLATDDRDQLGPLTEYTVVDLTQLNWEQEMRQVLVRAEHPDIERVISDIEHQRAARTESKPLRYASVLPPGGEAPETSDMWMDSYVNCSYNQNGWVMHSLTGPSQGYGFWQGTQWPFGTPWTNPNIYTACDSLACMGIAHYWFYTRAPKTFSFWWDGLFSVFDEWCA